MATPRQIEMKLMAPRCLNNIPFSDRAQCPGMGALILTDFASTT